MANGNGDGKITFIKWSPVVFTIITAIFAVGIFYATAKDTTSDVKKLEARVVSMSLQMQTLATKLEEAEKRDINMQNSLDNMYKIMLENARK